MSQSSPGNLLLRADASSTIGTGHIMRCLALAQAWQDAGGAAAFACAELPQPLEVRLESEGFPVHAVAGGAGSSHDREQTKTLIESTQSRWLVLDGYRFVSEFQSGVQDARWHVLVLDDDARHDAYHSSLILNQNVAASASLYDGRVPQGRLLLQPTYALLRREFLQSPRAPQPTRDPVARVMVMLGGADAGNLTQAVLEACQLCSMPGAQVHAVIGPANQHAAELRAFSRGKEDRVVLHVSPADLPKLMAGCDLAISAAGSSVYEFGYLGVPLMVIQTADNQKLVAGRLDELGAAVRIDERLLASPPEMAAVIQRFMTDPARRRECAATMRGFVDGKGAQRVVDAMREIERAKKLKENTFTTKDTTAQS